MPEKDKNHTTWQIKGSAFVQIEMKKKESVQFWHNWSFAYWIQDKACCLIIDGCIDQNHIYTAPHTQMNRNTQTGLVKYGQRNSNYLLFC